MSISSVSVVVASVSVKKIFFLWFWKTVLDQSITLQGTANKIYKLILNTLGLA